MDPYYLHEHSPHYNPQLVPPDEHNAQSQPVLRHISASLSDSGNAEAAGNDTSNHASPAIAMRYKAKTELQCPGCDNKFERMSALKQALSKHLLCHTGEKPHSCDGCNRRFSIASNARRHMRTCKTIKQRIAEGIPPAPSDALTTADKLRLRHGHPGGTHEALSPGHSTSSEDLEAEDEGSEAGWYSLECGTSTPADDYPSPSDHITAPGCFSYHPHHRSHPSTDMKPPPLCPTAYPTIGGPVAYSFEPVAALQTRDQADTPRYYQPSTSPPVQSHAENTGGVRGQWEFDQLKAAHTSPAVKSARSGSLSENPQDGQHPRYAGYPYSLPSNTLGPLAIPHHQPHVRLDRLSQSAAHPQGDRQAPPALDFPTSSGQFRADGASPGRFDLARARPPVPPLLDSLSESAGQSNYRYQQATPSAIHSSRQDLSWTGSLRRAAGQEASPSVQPGSLKHHQTGWDAEVGRRD